MKIAIHQPDYFPYIGYFSKISKADSFIFLDDCQYSNNNYHNWNTIKTQQGKQKIKIPVQQHLGNMILEVRTKDELGWKENHISILESNYKQSKYFDEVISLIKPILFKQYENIADQNIAINSVICRELNITTNLYRSSDFHFTSSGVNRVLDICNFFGADEYLSGEGAAVYQKEKEFLDRGVKLTYIKFEPFPYTQLWGDFIPNLSILDFMMNCGVEHKDFLIRNYKCY